MAWAPGSRFAGLQISASLKLGPLQNNFSCQPDREAQVFRRNPCLPLQCCRYWSSNENRIPATSASWHFTWMRVNERHCMAGELEATWSIMMVDKKLIMINIREKLYWRLGWACCCSNHLFGWLFSFFHDLIRLTQSSDVHCYLIGSFPFHDL